MRGRTVVERFGQLRVEAAIKNPQAPQQMS